MAGQARRMLATVIVAATVGAMGPVAAQTSCATLRGKVGDQQGGVLPGATVTVRQTETNTTRTGITNESGQYYPPHLPSGTYAVTVELQGFTTDKRTLPLGVGQQATADFTLRVGGLAEQVEVQGQATVVETQSALGGMVIRKEIDSLPTIDRHFAGLAMLAPGISSSGSSSMGFSAAGQRQFQNNVFVDGATNAQQFYGTQAESYPQDWIQEFQVMTDGFSAKFGQATGGVLNVVTRSGANKFSGRAYGFYRNSTLDSPGYAGPFDTTGQPVFLAAVPTYHNYRVGGFLGGPVVTDKVFFFGGVEDYDNTQQAVLSISQSV